jgi:HlyD family secretion protein
VVALIEAPKNVALRSGMSARAELYLGDGKSQLAVPVEAVVEEAAEGGDAGEDTKHFVWVERDGKARKVAVETGPSDDRWQAITKGLAAGDHVITGPAKTLRHLSECEAVMQRKDAEGDADNDAAKRDGDAA